LACEAFWAHAHEQIEIIKTAATVLTWAGGTRIEVLTVGSKVVPSAGTVIGKSLGNTWNINA
jgi:hypothetical protein